MNNLKTNVKTKWKAIYSQMLFGWFFIRFSALKSRGFTQMEEGIKQKERNGQRLVSEGFRVSFIMWYMQCACGRIWPLLRTRVTMIQDDFPRLDRFVTVRIAYRSIRPIALFSWHKCDDISCNRKPILGKRHLKWQQPEKMRCAILTN